MKPNDPKSTVNKEVRQVPDVEEEAFDAEENRLIDELKLGLGLLERSVPVFPPGAEALERQLAEHRQTLRKKLQRDLAIFMSVAACVLAGTIAVLSSVPVVWVVMQILAMLAVPVVIALHHRKRAEDV